MTIERKVAIAESNADLSEVIRFLNIESDHQAEPFPENPPSEPLSGKKSGPIYNLHPYWSKKPFDAIAKSVSQFTREGEIVLDPFCGSGSTLVGAYQAGRRALGLDLSPAAFHIARFYMLGLTKDGASSSVVNSWLNEIRDATKNARTVRWRGSNWEIQELIYSEQYRCPKCFTFRSVGRRILLRDEYCCDSAGCEQPISTRSKLLEFGPAQITNAELTREGTKKSISVDVLDEPELLEALTRKDEEISLDLLKREIPDALIAQELLDYGGRLNSTSVVRASDLYTPRSLYVLCIARERALSRQSLTEQACLLGLLTAVALNCTKMYRVREGGGGGPATSFYVPPERKEVSALGALRDKAKLLERVGNELLWKQERIGVANLGVGDLERLPTSSIDYIFTDPPYADTMPYGALNCVTEAWLGRSSAWRTREVIAENWEAGMREAFQQMARVLKPGRWLTLCYHDTSEGSWVQIQDIAAEAGLVADKASKALYISTSQKSWQQQVGTKVVKRDLLVHFQKPVIGRTASLKSEGDFESSAKAFLIQLLSDRPGISADRAYDELISHFIRLGTLKTHDFMQLLHSVAEPTDEQEPRWFLKTAIDDIKNSVEVATEEAAASQIIRFVKDSLKENDELEGIHFSDIFGFYVVAVEQKPRRRLQDWIVEYLFVTEQGTYRPPRDLEEEKVKSGERSAGVGRRIKRFFAMLDRGDAIPSHGLPSSEELSGWIRHCKRVGWYEYGKCLFEKGGIDMNRLSDEVQAETQEDYEVCVRAIRSLNAK